MPTWLFIQEVLLTPDALDQGQSGNRYHKEYCKHRVLDRDLETNVKELSKQRSEDYLWLCKVQEMSELEISPGHELNSPSTELSGSQADAQTLLEVALDYHSCLQH